MVSDVTVKECSELLAQASDLLVECFNLYVHQRPDIVVKIAKLLLEMDGD